MFNKFIDTSSALYESNEPFAIAYVVKKAGLSSGKPGDKAIIKKDGTLIGWIGGGCSKGIVIKEALEAMQDGKPRLIAIHPGAQEGSEKGVKTYSMSCHSGGAVDLFIEPILPKPELIIVGQSHVAMYLSKIAKALEFRVTCVATTNNTGLFDEDQKLVHNFDHFKGKGLYIVVCTQGEGDEQALMSALSLNYKYISFVSSRRKSNAIFKSLRGFGISFDQLKDIKTPSGLDINAKLPEEVAVSIMAEIIQTYRNDADASEDGEKVAINPEMYINPVCGIPVQKNTAKHILEFEGEKVYFCCDGCKVKFEEAPEKYMVLS